ncbi:MAG: methyltransferase domain-containing protein, partial [Bacteroidota bacterium]
MDDNLVQRFKNEYRDWCERTSQTNQDNLAGLMTSIRPEESKLIASGISVLDVGCGSGKRTFPAYNQMNLIYFGIDFQPQQDPLIRTFDITGDIPLKTEDFEGNSFDTIVFLGGALCGAFGYEEMRKAITNVSPVLNAEGKIVVDVILSSRLVLVYEPATNTYLHKDLNSTHQNESNGVVFRLAQDVPPQ